MDHLKDCGFWPFMAKEDDYGFLSFVAAEGDDSNPPGIFVLTDKEAFSLKGLSLLTGMCGNKFLGHTAIRKYFQLPNGSGRNQKVDDFWNAEKLPPELAAMVKTPKEFMKRWGKMWFAGFVLNENLAFMICRAPKTWAAMAWKQLLKQDFGHQDLFMIMMNAPKIWADKAWKLFSDDWLVMSSRSCDVIINCPEPYKLKAWKWLLNNGRSVHDRLKTIIAHPATPQDWKAKAAKQFLKLNLKNPDLIFVVLHAPEPYQGKAYRQLLRQGASNNDLCGLINLADEPYQAKAWERLLKHLRLNQGTANYHHNYHLRLIMESSYSTPIYKCKAAEQLWEKRQDTHDLHIIIEHAPEPWRSQAITLLPQWEKENR